MKQFSKARVFGRITAATAGVALLLTSSASQRPASKSPLQPVTFSAAVGPLFAKACVGCHGKLMPKAGLDLRTAGDILQGSSRGSVVSPGKPEESRLYTIVSSGAMPPGGPKVGSKELKALREWIASGASAVGSPGGHWSFVPPVRPKLPTYQHSGWEKNPIDRFIGSRLKASGLGPSPQASRQILARRVYFDLVGVPPSPAELDLFLADRSARAYDSLVDRLLADPRFGEKWARHWLDSAGYADSEGVLQEDLVRANAWRYRDYVIRSFNADKPYDQFVREQIAGDEMSGYRTAARFTPQMLEQVTATGFLRTTVDATRADFNPHQFAEYQYRMLHDTQTIVTSTILGVPIQCARCHDHKYEPFSQRDYYRLQSVFQGAVRPLGTLLPTAARQIVAAGSEERAEADAANAKVDTELREIAKREVASLDSARMRIVDREGSNIPSSDKAALIESVRLEDAARSPAQKETVEKYKAVAALLLGKLAESDATYKVEVDRHRADRVKAEAKRVHLLQIRAFYDQDAKPPQTRILRRGEWSKPADPVEPGVPAVLEGPNLRYALAQPKEGDATTLRRTALADWLVGSANPLTSRVIVNRIWSQHFGVGIAPMVENLGRSGLAPSHPELLDWLAVELAAGVRATQAEPRSGAWSLKALHRLIVTSATYKQASTPRREALGVDPDNKLLWRQRPRRIEAESMRDAALAAAGNLDAKMYGESVALDVRATGEIAAAGEAVGGRRSIYLQARRTTPVTLLNVFDQPVMETNCSRRTVSTTATQALTLMNSSFVATQAVQLAKRVLREAPPVCLTRAPIGPQTVSYAYLLTLSRRPSALEQAAAAQFIEKQMSLYSSVAGSEDCALSAYSDFCHALLSSNEFVYVD